MFPNKHCFKKLFSLLFCVFGLFTCLFSFSGLDNLNNHNNIQEVHAASGLGINQVYSGSVDLWGARYGIIIHAYSGGDYGVGTGSASGVTLYDQYGNSQSLSSIFTFGSEWIVLRLGETNVNYQGWILHIENGARFTGPNGSNYFVENSYICNGSTTAGKENYTWNDITSAYSGGYGITFNTSGTSTTSSSLSVTITIFNTLGGSNSFLYTVWSDNTSVATVSGSAIKSASGYPATVTITVNRASVGSFKIYCCNLARTANASFSFRSDTYIDIYPDVVSVTYDQSVSSICSCSTTTGKFSIKSYNSTYLSVSLSNTSNVSPGTNVTVTIQCIKYCSSDLTVTVEFTPSNSYYNSSTRSYTVKTSKWSVGIPGNQTNSLTYNGSSQAATFSNFDSTRINVTGNSAINAGNYNATFTLKDSANCEWSDGSTSSKSKAWSIARTGGSCGNATANSLTFNGKDQALVTAPSSATGTVYYALGNSSGATTGYSSNIPTGYNAGDYYVYYYAAESTNYSKSSTKNIKVTISKATNPITYASTQSASFTYSSSTQTTTDLVGASNAQGSIYYTISSQPSGNYFSLSNTYQLTVAPNTPVDTYSVTIKANASGNGNYNSKDVYSTVTVNITKTAGYITKDVTARNSTYNGTDQQSVNEGTGTGTMYYALGDESEPKTSYSTSIPNLRDAGTYYIWSYCKGDNNHTDTTPKKTVVTISPKSIVGASYSKINADNVIFDGDSHQANVSNVIIDSLNVTYDLSFSRGGYLSTDFKIAGEITVTITGNANFAGSISFTYIIDGTLENFYREYINKAGEDYVTNCWACAYRYALAKDALLNLSSSNFRTDEFINAFRSYSIYLNDTALFRYETWAHILRDENPYKDIPFSNELNMELQNKNEEPNISLLIILGVLITSSILACVCIHIRKKEIN